MAVYHPRKGQPYHQVNSIRGIRRAKRKGYTEIDLDMQMTKDRVIVGTHWPRPMFKDGFRDPYRELSRLRTVASMTWEEVRRLKAGRFPRTYRIQRIERLLQECARRGVGAVLEPKGDNRFDQDWPWVHIASVADDCGADVRVYSFQAEALAAAKRHGFQAKELHR